MSRILVAPLETTKLLWIAMIAGTVGCGDDTSVDQSTEESSGPSSSGVEESTAGSSSEGTWTTETGDSSTSAAEIPDEPPGDDDFGWEPVPALDCGERGHVIHDAGPPTNRVNFVILGDGYTQAELEGTYADHVYELMKVMFGSAGFPYNVYTSSVNICRIDVVSNESGIDFPAQGTEVDTALDAWGEIGNRLAYVDQRKLELELHDALSTSNVEADWVAVALNTSSWVAAGGYPMIWPGGNHTSEIGVHEAGHTFHDLADEYGEGQGAYMGAEPEEINVTADLMSEKWAPWRGFDQERVGVIDFYEGGRYHEEAIWRPSLDGRMRTVTRDHNAPSIEKIIRDIYQLAPPVDDFSPKVMGEYPPALGLRVVDEDRVVVDWLLDGETILEGVGPRVWTAQLEPSPGAHLVTAVVRDPTQWVRGEDRSVLETRVSWPIEAPATTGEAPKPAPTPIRLSDARRRPPTAHASAPSPVAHPLDSRTRRTIAANAELLRASAEITAGELARARARLDAHERDFGPMHEADREMLRAALGCRGRRASAVPARPTRFAKQARRACK